MVCKWYPKAVTLSAETAGYYYEYTEVIIMICAPRLGLQFARDKTCSRPRGTCLIGKVIVGYVLCPF